MSVKVATSWECPACNTHNSVEIVKPGVARQPTVRTFVCTKCASKFMLKFNKVHAEHAIRYEFIRCKWSEDGLAILRDKKRNEKQNPAPASDNQGVK